MIYVRDFIYLLLAIPAFFFKVVFRGKKLSGIKEKLGFGSAASNSRKCFWIHGVSVGEVLAARPLIDNLKLSFPGMDIKISTTTATGYEVAKKNYGSENVFYYPLDFSFSVRKTLKRINPACIFLMELEIWPNFVAIAADNNISVVLINGRISERSFRGYRRWRFFIGNALRGLSHYCVQDEEYADRLRRLDVGPEHISVTGSLKYDAVNIAPDESVRKEWGRLLNLGDDEKVIVAGSTHPGEERVLFDALLRLGNEKNVGRVRMVIAPRHPERWNEVERLAGEMGVSLVRKSALGAEGDSSGVVLLDVMGELSGVYNIADIVFVGGSLIPHGGQNMIEPAGLGKAILFGPYTFNFAQTVSVLKAGNAAVELAGESELFGALKKLLEDDALRKKLGESAQAVIFGQRGAVDKTVGIIKQFVTID